MDACLPERESAFVFVEEEVWDPLSGLMYGGSPRLDALKTINDAMSAHDVEISWVDGLNDRRLSTELERISNGAYDVVFILVQFISHTASKAIKQACKKAGVRCVYVRGGYGSRQILSAYLEGVSDVGVVSSSV
jgi:hypothetical protein